MQTAQSAWRKSFSETIVIVDQKELASHIVCSNDINICRIEFYSFLILFNFTTTCT